MAFKTYAVLGSTGNCGRALIQNLLHKHGVNIHACCRDQSKLLRLLPDVKPGGSVKIFTGSIDDVELLTSCLRDCQAVFLVVSTNDNIPGCRVAQDTATAVVASLQNLKQSLGESEGNDSPQLPKLILLSSATIDDHWGAPKAMIISSQDGQAIHEGLLCEMQQIKRPFKRSNMSIHAYPTDAYPATLLSESTRLFGVTMTTEVRYSHGR